MKNTIIKYCAKCQKEKQLYSILIVDKTKIDKYRIFEGIDEYDHLITFNQRVNSSL